MRWFRMRRFGTKEGVISQPALEERGARRSSCDEVAAKWCWLLPPRENSRWAFSGLS